MLIQAKNSRTALIFVEKSERFRIRIQMCKMSPPLPVTEDTPPDMLAGAMDLHVVLPNGQDMKMSVERSTPMMDLLVQVTTANKISPGGHVIQAIGDRGVLPYKPSTPIGALDTWTIHIVPKKKAGMILKKPFTKPIPNTPFEQTFRLQVNLPRNQLYVSRVSYRTRLEDVLNEVCKEKNLDQSKYCFTHPDNLEEELDLKKTFLDHKVQQLTLISKNNRPVGLSSSDVIALKRYDSRNQHVNNKYYASHSYDGSVSSGSMEGRSLSPVRSDESSSSPTIPKTNSILNRPFRKRRPAPKPPASQNGHEAKNVSESLTISHSRNSSDSSGYHESSVLSESPESNSNSLADSLPRRSKLPDKTPSNVKGQGPHMNGKIGASLSRSLSNLVAVGDSKSRTFLSNGIRHKEYSASSMSLASIGGKKKKAPAPPPPMSKSLLSLQEESSSTPATTLNGDFTSNSRNFASIPEDVVSKSQTLPATSNKLSTFSTAPPTSISTSTSSYASSNKTTTTTTQRTPTKPDLKPSPVAAARSVDKCSAVAVDEVDSGKITSLTKSSPTTTMVNGNTNAIIKPEPVKNTQSDVKDKELTMDDEEIDRIFHDATKDYESPSLPVLPSPPKLTNGFDEAKCQANGEDPFNWEYKLPSPPRAFRDQSSSPSVTEYDTVTIGNLTEVVTEKRLVPEEKASAPPNKYKVIPQLDPMGVNVMADIAKQMTIKIEPMLLTANTSSAPSTTTSAKKTYYEESNSQSSMDNHCQKSENVVASGVVAEKHCNCDKTPYIDVNYVSTNDSGLGSDESIPSVSEGRSCIEEPTSSMSSCVSSASSLSYAKKQPQQQPQQQIQQTTSTESKAPERRGSTLQNFTITTYQSSKPTEIFHDDSVKTSKTTQIAKNNHPYVKLPFEKRSDSKGNGLSRHSSFSTEKSPNNPVKRSKSHISLLSGNFAKFNRFGKLNIKEDDSSEQNSPVYSSSESIQTAEDIKPKVQPTVARLRKTLSEISINKDCNRGDDELLELQDQVMKWKQNDERMSRLKAKNVPELQSVQVLKDILPQINKPQLPPEVQSITSKTALEENYPSRARAFKVDVRAKNSCQDSSATPAVNLQSWNERPKRQVSIKTDRDYVFGNIRRHAEMFSSNQNGSETGVADQSKCDQDSTSKSAGSDNNTDPSRVPIVRAVEFKKPFVQQLEKTYQVNDPVKNVNKEKPRPASCYMFGDHLTNGVSRSQSMMVNNTKPTQVNGTEPISTKVNGIVNGHSNYDDNTTTTTKKTTTTETTTSSYTNNVSKTKIMFNCSAPYNNKYKSVTEITEDTTIKRHSYPVFTTAPATNPPESSATRSSEQYTFRNYKNKLLETEKLNGNDNKSTPAEKPSTPKQSPEKKSFFRIFRKEQSPQPAEVITTKSVGIPPPPPVMPSLKPVSQNRMSYQKPCSENPRDVLLSSIKNFNRDNLRNVRVK
ncbi:uncharacterized protein LOC135847116 isoform X2 [Planococcus citri]|uniref:uncharacterized protein LOC135847116 isoform X2 n=1 Tax=Planococcus citri TaxID=170843 RepID=UPI0031F9309F